jgi:hypothetical protein
MFSTPLVLDRGVEPDRFRVDNRTLLAICVVIVVCLVAGAASARGWLDGTDPNNRLRAASVAGAIALIAALSTLYYRWIWHDLQTFAAVIDSCPTLFCDFEKHF